MELPLRSRVYGRTGGLGYTPHSQILAQRWLPLVFSSLVVWALKCVTPVGTQTSNLADMSVASRECEWLEMESFGLQSREDTAITEEDSILV